MGLKSTVKPNPIMVQPQSKDTTPSATPIGPTPLVGNWCDLPWAGDESTATPAKVELFTKPGNFFGETAIPLALTSDPVKLFQQTTSKVTKNVKDVDTLALALGIPRLETTDATVVVETSKTPEARAGTAVPEDDETMDDLYLTTPMETFVAEDFEVAPAVAQPVMPVTQSYAQEACQLPVNASHFVDFRRLQQQPPVSQPAINPAYYAPQSGYQRQAPRHHAPQQQRVPVMQVSVAAPANTYCATPANTYTAIPAPAPRGPVVVLISRFPPPPPLSKSTMNTMLRTGSSFDAYYAIVMRWYDKVCRSVPKAHPTVAVCPPAELYLHDFPGWVDAIDQWWARHFTRRPRRTNAPMKQQ